MSDPFHYKGFAEPKLRKTVITSGQWRCGQETNAWVFLRTIPINISYTDAVNVVVKHFLFLD